MCRFLTTTKRHGSLAAAEGAAMAASSKVWTTSSLTSPGA
jgi:hypothetical protein